MWEEGGKEAAIEVIGEFRIGRVLRATDISLSLSLLRATVYDILQPPAASRWIVLPFLTVLRRIDILSTPPVVVPLHFCPPPRNAEQTSRVTLCRSIRPPLSNFPGKAILPSSSSSSSLLIFSEKFGWRKSIRNVRGIRGCRRFVRFCRDHVDPMLMRVQCSRRRPTPPSVIIDAINPSQSA